MDDTAYEFNKQVMICSEPDCKETGLPQDVIYEVIEREDGIKVGEFVEAHGPVYCNAHASDHGYCASCGCRTDDTYLVNGRHRWGGPPCRYCETCYEYGAWWS